MNELEKFLKNVALISVGAVASVVEKGSELAKMFADKGEETVRQSQDAVDEISRKMRKAAEEARMDVSKFTAEQRAELRRRLDAFEEAEKAAVESLRAELDAAEQNCGAEDAEDAEGEDAPVIELKPEAKDDEPEA